MVKWKAALKYLPILLPVVLFALLAVFLGGDLAAKFDAKFYTEVTERMNPVLTKIMLGITHFGDPWTVLAFAGGFFLFKGTRKRLAPALVLGVIASTGINLFLKDLFSRERPDILRLVNETTYSFPSGHAMINTAFYAILAYFIIVQVRDARLRGILLAACALPVLLISVSRVYLGVHYTTDVLGGFLFGLTVAGITIRFFKKRLTEGRS